MSIRLIGIRTLLFEPHEEDGRETFGSGFSERVEVTRDRNEMYISQLAKWLEVTQLQDHLFLGNRQSSIIIPCAAARWLYIVVFLGWKSTDTIAIAAFCVQATGLPLTDLAKLPY